MGTTNGITGTVSYAGGVVSGTHPIGLYFTDSYVSSSTFNTFRWVTTSGGAFTVYGMPNGNYYMAMVYNNVGDGTIAPRLSHVGDTGKYYNITACNASSATAIAVSGAVNNVGALSFDTTNTLQGYAGIISYGGSAGGTVNSCTPLVVAIYSPTDSTYSSSVIYPLSVNSSGTRYDIITSSLGLPCQSESHYVQAWFAKSGNTSSPGVGDPKIQLGLLANGTTASLNITVP